LSWERTVSKKKGVDPVKTSPAPPLIPADFTPRFDAAARRAGLRPELFGEIHGLPLLAYTKRTPGPRPRAYLSAGIHGDEPAPPWALLRLVESGILDDRCTWFVCPLLNPTGFIHRTRENHAKVDLNRDYKALQTAETRAHVAWLQRQPGFDLVVCVHEDWEAHGFYLYELNPDQRPSLAHPMLAAARALGPIERATVIDGREIAEPGIIRPDSDPELRETWPEAIYLRQHHSRLNYTIETASHQPLEQRVATHVAVLRAALAAFCDDL
jgi:protein MpaA